MVKRVAMMLGCYDIYLWNEMMRPDSDVVFEGDVRSVVACYFICQQMCRLRKAVRLNLRKQQGPWGRWAELDEAAHRYTQLLAEGIMDNGIFIGGTSRTLTGCTIMRKNITPGPRAERMQTVPDATLLLFRLKYSQYDSKREPARILLIE